MSDIPLPEPPPAPAAELTLAPPAVTAPPAPTATALTVRIWCILVFSLCAAMLAAGAWLKPSPDGSGTHRQFGMPACGMLAMTGIPCPTCGCTTAVSHFAHGNLLASLFTQPFGFGIALLAVILLPFTLIGIATGKWRGPSMFWLSWHWQYWVYGSIALLLFGWLYKVIAVRMGLSW